MLSSRGGLGLQTAGTSKFELVNETGGGYIWPMGREQFWT